MDMIEEKNLYETDSKVIVEDDGQLFMDTAPDEISTASTAIIDDIDIANFEETLDRLIFNKLPTDKFRIHEDIIKLLAGFLNVGDYEVNLLSSWMLRTIAEQIVNKSRAINTRDYGTFVLWLCDEFNAIRDNPNMEREEFFKLLNGIFYDALSVILKGKGLLLLSRFLNQKSNEEEFIENFSTRSDYSISIAYSHLHKRMEDGISEDETLGFVKSDEELLNSIIESTYEVFGTDLNFTLIQGAYESQNNIEDYVIPYRFRIPRTIKKADFSKLMPKAPIEKPKKKGKSKRKSSTIKPPEEIKAVPIFDINDFLYILPLSEALEATDIMNIHTNN